jgi:hypothetical protein
MNPQEPFKGITYKGITFENYETLSNYALGDGNALAAQKAAAELTDLANNVPLPLYVTPSCAYLQQRFLNSLNVAG